MSELSPSVLTIIAGLQNNGALQVHPTINTAASALISKASVLDSVGLTNGNTASRDYANVCTDAAAHLTSMSGNIWQSNPTKFGLVLQQVLGHLSTAGTINSSTSFINSTAFTEYGSGITSVGSMSTQGLDVVLGSLTSAATVMDLVGPAYDLTDIKNFGTSVGVVKKLNQVKLAKAIGLNDALTTNGVDMDNLEDPVYADVIDRTLSSVTDANTLREVTVQLKLDSTITLTSLLDLTDINKLVPAGQRTGLSASLKDMGQKFADMGASFNSPSAASTMLRSISVPSTPNLSSQTNIASLMGSLSGAIASATGTGSNPNGLPNVTDFTQPVSGGFAVNRVIANINATATTLSTDELTSVTDLETMITQSKSLFSLAKIDLTQSPTISLNTLVSFATVIGSFGTDTTGSNVANVITAMTTSDIYGDAVKSTMSESINNQKMAAAGIKPLTFKG